MRECKRKSERGSMIVCERQTEKLRGRQREKEREGMRDTNER